MDGSGDVLSGFAFIKTGLCITECLLVSWEFTFNDELVEVWRLFKSQKLKGWKDFSQGIGYDCLMIFIIGFSVGWDVLGFVWGFGGGVLILKIQLGWGERVAN